MKAYDLSDLNVLIVDDNKHMQILLKEVLRAFHVRQIQTPDDGADALKLLRTFPADIIITDLNMKPLDGLEFVSLVRTSADSTCMYLPIIMLTGHTEMRRVIEARDAGVNEFLGKPVAPNKLYERIVRIIECPRMFINVRSYTGPDRRRVNHSGQRAYTGKERRKDVQPPVNDDLQNTAAVGQTQAGGANMSQAEISALFG